MDNLVGNFLRVAVLWALAGMALGIAMAASHNHQLMPVHAHVNLLGWVSMALFGLFFRTHPAALAGRLPQLLFWLINFALALMTVSLSALLLGVAAAEPVAALSGFLLLGAMAIFAVIVFRATRAA